MMMMIDDDWILVESYRLLKCLFSELPLFYRSNKCIIITLENFDLQNPPNISIVHVIMTSAYAWTLDKPNTAIQYVLRYHKVDF
jgi:hypothetical protein